MTAYPYDSVEDPRPAAGLIVLQADETIEDDFRRLVPMDLRLLVSRIPSGVTVSSETLGAMEGAMTEAAALFPREHAFAAIGYACTSGAAQIGPENVAARVRDGAETAHVTDPMTALHAACQALGVRRLALLSPYVASVSATLRRVLADRGVDTPVFGSFDEAVERNVVRIAEASTAAAAEDLVRGQEVDALFLSCTNLKTLGIVRPLERKLGLPVLSSNLVLAWHLLRLSLGTAPALPRDLLSDA